MSSVVGAALLLTLAPGAAAQAHSLDSSTIAVRLTDDSAEATVSMALETLDDALGTSYAAASELTIENVAAIVDYIDDHLSVTGAAGAEWSEIYSGAIVSSVEGIQSFSVDVSFDTGGVDPTFFVIEYDAIIESDTSHEAVVVLTDAAGNISTAGVITSTDRALAVGEAVEPGLLDMVSYGFHHVLEGADHLLFLIALLLVAPLVPVAGHHWSPQRGFGRSLRRVVTVATAFTVGHSLTLIASALGWIALPSGVVEVLVATSVAVAAAHAIRPLFRRGEPAIAGLFGLVHGLAFAGILAKLGFAGGLSIITLLAFNVGVELAQLATIALVFPSLYLMSRSQWGSAVRRCLALTAITVAAFWILDRIGVLANPFEGIEDAVVANSWIVAVILAIAATAAWAVDRVRSGQTRALTAGQPTTSNWY